MEIQSVTHFVMNGEIFETLAEAQRAAAISKITERVLGAGMSFCNTAIENPHFMARVLNDYINDLSAIKPATVILVDKFVPPGPDAKGWPIEANSSHYIVSFSRMREEVARLMQAGNKIGAIKIVRLCFGPNKVDLREAKNWVEAL